MVHDTDDGPGAGAPRPAAAGRRPRAPGHRLDPEARRRIGGNLRVLYADILEQPIPDRFAGLLADLAARTGEETSR